MIYDCIVVGGGPAGLSAAIYMGRFLRKTAVLDEHAGRSSHEQVNDNYLGFPNGIRVKDLLALGRQQAQRFGVQMHDCRVEHLERVDWGREFRVRTNRGIFSSRTIILATGVTDIWPAIEDADSYVGKTLFWCITCDGFRAHNRSIVLFGEDDEAATTALQFLIYTSKIAFVMPPGETRCTPERLETMRSHGIQVWQGRIERVEGTPESVSAVVLDGGRRVRADLMFGLLGCRPNTDLAREVGVKCSPEGYIVVDSEGYTSVPGVFAAGDVSQMHTHQVVSAAHEGAEAAQTASYYLYAGFQKERRET